MSNTKIMASNGSDSFFIPETPLTTKTEKATWEMLSNDAKFSHVCKTLMDDSDSDSDVIVLTEAEKEMFLQDHALLPQPEKKDRLASMKEDQEQKALTKFRYAKENCKKSVSLLSDDDSGSADGDYNLLKRLKTFHHEIRAEKKQNQQHHLLESTHPKLKFVYENFVGFEKYEVMEATNEEGVVFKRILLPNNNIAHEWIMDSEKKLFRIEGDKVVVKKEMARGLVNITRTVRPSFTSLWNINFEDKK